MRKIIRPKNSDGWFGTQAVATSNDPYYNLCAAVIGQACEDYMGYKLGRAGVSEQQYDSAVRFLDDNCPEYQLYSQGVSASYLIEQMDKMIAKKKKGKKR